MYQDLPLRIHSAVADPSSFYDERGSAAVCLWYLCRAIDNKGSGRADFSLSEASASLGRSIPTIKKYLVNGKKLGLFRTVTRVKDSVTVYYGSVHAVGIQNGLMQLGAIAEIQVKDLRNLRFWGTQLAMQALQTSSRWLARLNSPRGTRIAKPSEVLSSSSSSQGARKIIYKGRRCAFVTKSFTLFGVSLKRIAEKTGRSLSTVQRRLCNRYRGDRNIEPVRKKQLVQVVEKEAGAIAFSILEIGSRTLGKLFYYNGSTWRSGCNVYEDVLSIQSGKACKYWYRRRIQAEFPSGN